MTEDEARRLVRFLLSQGSEIEWVEHKHNFADPDGIGEYVSALSNSAAIAGQDFGYLLWGIEDKTAEILGTNFDPSQCKKGNQPLHIAISSGLQPRTAFEFEELEVQGQRLVLLKVESATERPVSYLGTEYIRIGESKTKLSAHPDRERKLWQSIEQCSFEVRDAKSGLDDDEVLKLLDYPRYFDLLGRRLPDNRHGILEALAADGITRNEPRGWCISIFGALLFAKSLSDIDSVSRKGVRVITYRGDDRVAIRRQQSGNRGYAVGFVGLIKYIADQLPETVEIGSALRTSTPTLPEVAVREIVANALIHQDLSISGTGPLIEIFDSRVEITNPGSPLVPVARFADMPPRSRNERMASLMRRMGMCEELGTGIDRVLSLVEVNQLPAPDFKVLDGSVRVTLFGAKSFASMTKEDRIRACYWHAVICYLRHEAMTNGTLRERLGVEDKNYSQVSRVIADAVEANLVKRDPPDDTSKRHAKYVPIWA